MLIDDVVLLQKSEIIARIIFITVQEQEQDDDFRIKIRVALRNGWQMDCWERIRPGYRRYSFHVFQDEQEITRWDNSPYHPEVSTFPHHQHIRGRVVDSEEMDLSKVLAQLESMM